MDETALQAAVEKTELEIELQNKIWKWKTSNNFKGFTIKKKHEIEETFLREKQKNKQDLRNVKVKKHVMRWKKKISLK